MSFGSENVRLLSLAIHVVFLQSNILHCIDKVITVAHPRAGPIPGQVPSQGRSHPRAGSIPAVVGQSSDRGQHWSISSLLALLKEFVCSSPWDIVMLVRAKQPGRQVFVPVRPCKEM